MRRRIIVVAFTVATFLALNVVPALAIFRPGH